MAVTILKRFPQNLAQTFRLVPSGIDNIVVFVCPGNQKMLRNFWEDPPYLYTLKAGFGEHTLRIFKTVVFKRVGYRRRVLLSSYTGFYH